MERFPNLGIWLQKVAGSYQSNGANLVSDIVQSCVDMWSQTLIHCPVVRWTKIGISNFIIRTNRMKPITYYKNKQTSRFNYIYFVPEQFTAFVEHFQEYEITASIVAKLIDWYDTVSQRANRLNYTSAAEILSIRNHFTAAH